MPTEAEENGPAYLRLYRSLEDVVTYERFVDVCTAQGLPRPSKRMFQHVRRLYRDGQPNYVTMNAHDQMRKARRRQWTVERVENLIEVKARENERLEYKRQMAGDDTTKKPWAAMANVGGGDVLYGIGEVKSQADRVERVRFQGIEERIQQLNSGIDPPVGLSITLVPIGGDDGGVVSVRVAPSPPGVVHFVANRAPVRSGTTTRFMTSEEIRRWIREAQRPAHPGP